ncbi:DUF305 domain-containing protein [Arthrobacter sp. ISL-30]|uniref:DUF305 domain-containing protein n=1 Tax=Arthrobacter sp. ISL-30 TaxID=2819109 RepID=UPI001BE7CFA5|nr:DUF305 domain-containing protein [Arthrobacter sp. ISL-30]MBT2515480.1 DUF305 domain-containing protein [Arthrobacter sp. ISL-30]
MKKILALTATALAAAITLAGCSTGSGGGSMPGMDHGTSTATSGTTPGSTTAAGDHNSADTMFAQMMIPHHAQAIEMSDMILAKKDIPATVTALAGRIKAAQGPEIEKMTGWLKAWNEPTQMSGGHGMSGMMGDEDMKKLDAAQGTEAAKLFLTQMIAHHEGAITMARTETTDGKNPDAVALAREIISAQEAEIKEMKDLLGTL